MFEFEEYGQLELMPVRFNNFLIVEETTGPILNYKAQM